MLDQTINFNKFKSTEIIQTMFFHHMELKLVTERYLKILNMPKTKNDYLPGNGGNGYWAKY